MIRSRPAPPMCAASRARALMLLAALAGCGERRSAAPATDSTAVGVGAPVRRYAAVQLAAFDDSARATRMRDSLARTGWTAVVRPARPGGASAPRRWRVLVSPTPQLAFTEVLAYALRRSRPGGAIVVQDSGAAPIRGVIGFSRVSYGSHGMSARARWARSPDGRSLLAIEDPAAVENEPVPNGFLFATEHGLRSVQMDSVWDAAPSPDWRRVAFGRAYVVSGEQPDSTAEQWERLADTIRLPVRKLRSGAFSVSGMAMMQGLAQPGVVDVDSVVDEALAPRLLYPVLAGWRVGWSPDGNRVLAGLAPEQARDDAPATRWLALDPEDGSTRTERDLPDMAPVAWTEGPTLDVSIPPDTSRRSMPIDGGTVESGGGWIRVRGRLLGPGTALAATQGGRFVLALVPNPSAREYDPKEMLAIYAVAP